MKRLIVYAIIAITAISICFYFQDNIRDYLLGCLSGLCLFIVLFAPIGFKLNRKHMARMDKLTRDYLLELEKNKV